MPSTSVQKPPQLPADAPGRPDRERYREQYGVIVICADAAAQRRVFEGLQAIGAGRLRLVTT